MAPGASPGRLATSTVDEKRFAAELEENGTDASVSQANAAAAAPRARVVMAASSSITVMTIA
jgi:hypothetical protein